jgi:hypothetical protein
MADGFWFKSDLFVIEAGEDLKTNPGCYGEALAHWLKAKLAERGYLAEEIIPEDWGWCVMLKREHYLWVGCGATQNEPKLVHESKRMVWQCFAVAEVPFWKFWFKMGKRSSIAAERNGVHQTLGTILRSEPRIELVDEP